MSFIYLIRHAEADYDWHGPDSGRPLSAKGVRQAQWMAMHLQGKQITDFRTAPHQRCQQTAAEIAAQLGIEPIEDESLHIARSFRIPALDGNSVWVSHSNNIPGAVAALGVPCYACGHASAWRLDFDESGKLAKYEYIEPEV